MFKLFPMLPFEARKEILGIWECRDPATINEPGVPTNVIRVQMRTQDVVDLFWPNTGAREAGEIRIAVHVIAGFLWAMLVVSPASIDKDYQLAGANDKAVECEV